LLPGEGTVHAIEEQVFLLKKKKRKVISHRALMELLTIRLCFMLARVEDGSLKWDSPSLAFFALF
jgi:hypothetical protein